MDLGIYPYQKGHTVTEEIKKNDQKIDLVTLTCIPLDAQLVTNAAEYVQQVEKLLKKWDKKVNKCRFEEIIWEQTKATAEQFKNFKMQQGYQLMQKSIKHFSSENNIRKMTPLPDIDFNELLGILDHLQIEESYVLDYVYYLDSIAGIPIVYARQTEAKPIDCLNNFPNWRNYLIDDHIRESLNRHFINHIRLDDSPTSYFQLAVLALYCNRFFLYWHSANRDETILANNQDILQIMQSIIVQIECLVDSTAYNKLTELQSELQQINITPYVVMNKDIVQTVFYYFTYSGGVYKVVWHVSREFPHIEINLTRQKIINYNKEVQF
ncbi:MAG TPA: hypothetical protein PLP19_18885 [bacterium]|nr:hypothetical protein [bacterium]HPN45563.1 hypothetical protein [bacterium]